MSYIRNTNIIALTTILLFLGILSIDAQIVLNNGSFEDTPADATMPSGWWYVDSGTTPDILPGYWGVYSDASEGDTFIGLITRENGTFESIGQRLSKTLVAGTCYQFTIDLAHSTGYVGYNEPIKVRIYVGSNRKSKDQLIYESDVIDNVEWETLNVEFNLEKNYRYFIIEVHSPKGPNIGGNVLIDNITTITNCNRV